MEKTAKKLFNTDMELYDMWAKMNTESGKLEVSQGKVAGGFKITSDYLSSLAQEDLPSAIEMLSKLEVSGALSVQTMNKLFNVDIHSRNIMSKVA